MSVILGGAFVQTSQEGSSHLAGVFMCITAGDL